MKKTLLLALALTSVSLAGCTDEAPDAGDATIIEAPVVTPPVMMDDSTAMDNGMSADPMATDTMGTSMEAAPMMEDTTTTM